LYHDMGLIFGICAPFVVGRSAVLLSPMAFLQRPARWMQLLARPEHLRLGLTDGIDRLVA